jgi:hypothetical protein
MNDETIAMVFKNTYITHKRAEFFYCDVCEKFHVAYELEFYSYCTSCHRGFCEDHIPKDKDLSCPKCHEFYCKHCDDGCVCNDSVS